MGKPVGAIVGEDDGALVGLAEGSRVGTAVGADVGVNVSGLNTALQIKHDCTPVCSPTDINDTVSTPCTVSSFKHWSSCRSKVTRVWLRSTGRIATKVLAVAVVTVPYMAGTVR